MTKILQILCCGPMFGRLRAKASSSTESLIMPTWPMLSLRLREVSKSSGDVKHPNPDIVICSGLSLGRHIADEAE
jgi:hypothetical protein